MVASLRVTQVKSTISHIARNRATIRALGLHRIGDIVVVPDNDATRGMVRAVRFLVSVEEIEGEGGRRTRRADRKAATDKAATDKAGRADKQAHTKADNGAGKAATQKTVAAKAGDKPAGTATAASAKARERTPRPAARAKPGAARAAEEDK